MLVSQSTKINKYQLNFDHISYKQSQFRPVLEW